MQHKLIPLALAIGALCGAGAALAQGAIVYGKLYPYAEQEKGSAPSAPGTLVSTLSPAATGVIGAPKTNGMSAGNSYLGFRGTEDMGDGLRAIYQLEGVVAVDTGGTGTFSFNRNTFVGMQGKFGTVKLGLMDTVFKEYGDTLGILGISSGTPVSSSNILRKTGFGTNNASRFHERRANSFRYDTPQFGPFQGGVQYATQENPTANIREAETWSFGLQYDQGPLYASLAYEQHGNFFGGSVNAPASMRNNGAADSVKSDDSAWQATVEWRITPTQKVEFDWITKSYKEGAVVNGRFQSYKNNAYMVAYDGRFDLFRVMAHYVRSDAGSCSRLNALCNTTGLQANQLTVGGGYNLSKRTFIYAVYSKITNGPSARFSAADFGSPTPGEDVRHLMAGISHSF